MIECDEYGKIIGPIEKEYAHSEGQRQQLTHYATWSMVFITSGKYGIQLKNKEKHDQQSAGKWDMGVAGHNCYIIKNGVLKALSFKETLIKEAEEEIGLSLTVVDSLGKFLQLARSELKNPIAFFFDTFHFKEGINNEFVSLAFILTPITKLQFKDKEVVDFQWLSPHQLSLFLRRNDNYCSPLPMVFNKAEAFRKQYLQDFFST